MPDPAHRAGDPGARRARPGPTRHGMLHLSVAVRTECVMASDAVASSVLAGLEHSRSWQEKLYRDVHQHAELSHQEQRTAGLVADRLRGAGYEVHEGVGGTGVVGVLRNGAGA